MRRRVAEFDDDDVQPGSGQRSVSSDRVSEVPDGNGQIGARISVSVTRGATRADMRKMRSHPKNPRSLTLEERVARLEESRKAPIDHAEVDQRWDCCKCLQLIGVLDTDQMILRINDSSRKLFCWIGVNDTPDVECVCRRCGQRNRLADLVKALQR